MQLCCAQVKKTIKNNYDINALSLAKMLSFVGQFVDGRVHRMMVVDAGGNWAVDGEQRLSFSIGSGACHASVCINTCFVPCLVENMASNFTGLLCSPQHLASRGHRPTRRLGLAARKPCSDTGAQNRSEDRSRQL